MLIFALHDNINTIMRKFLLLLSLLSGVLACSGGGNKTPQLRSEADLSGLTISCTNGNYYEHKFSLREDVTVFAANTDADALTAVRQGLANVLVTDEIFLPKKAQERLGVKLAMLGEDIFDVAFALRKGDQALKEDLDTFLAQYPTDQLVAHWMDGSPEPEYPSPRDGGNAVPIRYIVCMNMEPVAFLVEEGQWKGIDPDIIQRFAAWAGRPLEIKYLDIGSAITSLQTGQADIISGFLFVTDERKQFVDFSAPYFKCHPAYFVKDNDSGGRIGLADRIKINLVTEQRWKLITNGLIETVKITLLAILLGTILGVGVCAARRSRRKWLRSAASLYGAFIQGIPTLVLLMIMFYVIFAGSGTSASTVAVITFALCFASVAGSIFDTAVSSVPKGQTEAGLSLGFTPLKTFTGIVFPQALRRGLPLYKGECVSLLKSTSIVGYIAIQDLTNASNLIRSRTFDALVPLLLITVIYFVLAWMIRRLLNLLLLKK